MSDQSREDAPTTLGEALTAVAAELADGEPFGSFEYLSRHGAEAYLGFLTALGERSPTAAALLRALEQHAHGSRRAALRDPLVRRTIEDGVCTLVGGLDAIDIDTLDAVLALATEHVVAGTGTVIESAGRCVPFAPGSRRAVVWADPEPVAAPGRRFVGELLARLRGFRVHVPTEAQVQALADGYRRALDVAPELAGSALSHLAVVVLGDFDGQSAPVSALTVPGLPGVIVVSPTALAQTSSVAETIVHESLHLKFLDIEYVHPLFVTGFRPTSSPRITPPWHGDDVRYGGWPVDRLLTSMHVYLSLAVFFGIAAGRRAVDVGTPADCAARSEKYLGRAAWLCDAARGHHEQLSPAGQQFVAEIGALAARLGPPTTTSVDTAAQ